jgi:hypothetical protein
VTSGFAAAVPAWRAVLGMIVLLGTIAPGDARADRHELYTLLGYQPGVSRFRSPAGGDAAIASYAGAFDLTAYYGLSNTFHLGGRLRFSRTSDVRFEAIDVPAVDGTPTRGDVFADHLGFGFGALALYRVDTGYSLAPVFELEGGFTIHDYGNVVHVPTVAAYRTALPGISETVVHGSGTAILEYRFRNYWLASAGVGVQVEDGRVPWSVFVPFRVGRIW